MRDRVNEEEEDDEEDEKVASAKERLGLLGTLSSALDPNDSIDSGDGDEEEQKQKKPHEPPTSLLGATRNNDSSSDEDERVPLTKNEQVLQPSIFTTLGDLGSRSRNPYYS